MKSKVKKLLDEVEKYESNIDFNTNVSIRLNKTLNMYLESIDKSYENLKSSKLQSVYRRLNHD